MDKKLMAIFASQAISRAQLSGLSGAQLSGLSGAQLSWLSRAQLSGLSRAQLSWLSGEQLSGLSRAQLSWLSREQLSGLSREQLSWLSREQLSGLSREQLSWLSGAQLSGLSGAQVVPNVPSLYGRIWADIQAQLRLLDQSTFGPDEGPGGNVCGTPMCVAGHTVNLAGENGYALAKDLGFAGAALLIHRASCPLDVSPPRYDNCPNDWTAAYIELMAEQGY